MAGPSPDDLKKLADRRHETQRAAQARPDVQHAALTVSSNHNPKDLTLTGGITGNTSVHQIDGAETWQVNHEMKPEANAKGANGVRTEVDLQRLPSVAGMADFDNWKKSLKPDPTTHKVDDKLSAFEASKYFHKQDFKNEKADTIDHQLTYQEAVEDQLKQTKGMKNDIVLGIGNPNKALDTAKRDANGHIVDPGKGPVGDYLKNLGGQARWVANLAAADHAASRLEIGNEPNNDPILHDKHGDLVESLGYVNHHKVSDQANTDNYALVEGSLYNAIKSNNDLNGTRVDMAAPMQQPHAQQTMDFLAKFNAGGQLVGGMAADQEYYAKQLGWHQSGHELMTDETNMHLYATRKADGKFDTKDADSTLAATAHLSQLGYLPNRAAITETGVYDDARWQNNKWSEPTAAEAVDIANDQYTLLGHEVANDPFQIDGINTYCYGDAIGRGTTSDTALTATGYNNHIGYQGFLKPS